MAKRSLSYGLLVVCVLLIAGPGYGLYVLYPRFDLPVVIGLPLVLLAGGAGLASFFSPCSFPLLLTFLAQEPGDEEPGRARWRLAGGLATGAALFLLLLGGSFAVGGMALSKTVTFGSTTGIVLRLITGGTLIGLGLVQAGWVSDRPFRWVERQVAFAPADGNERLSFRALVLFGFGYVLAGFGWTGPILAGLAGMAVTAGGTTVAAGVYLLAAGTLVLTLFVLAGFVVHARHQVKKQLRGMTPAIKQSGGVLLILVGGYLMILALFYPVFMNVFPVSWNEPREILGGKTMFRRWIAVLLIMGFALMTVNPAFAGIRWLRIEVGGMAWPFCASGLEDKVAEHLKPDQYNVSVKRAEAVAIFEEHRAVSLKTARQAVEKSGFSYLGAELAARGHLEWSGQPGESELLLKDPKADMSLRLTASDTDTPFTTLKQAFQGGDPGDTVQVRGIAVESKQARKKARAAGARVTLSVTEWSPGKTAKLPPLVPEGNRKNTSANQDQGWF